MKKTVAALVLAAATLGSISVQAQELASAMDTLSQNLQVVLNTQDLNAQKAALQAMKVAAQDGKTQTPVKLENAPADGPQLADYRHGMDILMTQIDAALALAEKGDLNGAKTEAEKMKQIRNTYHQKYR